MSNTDMFVKVGEPGSATTLASPGHTIGGGTFNVGSTGAWPTDTAAIFAIDRTLPSLISPTNPSGRIDGTYTEWEGDVSSGTLISNAVIRYGTDQNYPAGSTTRVYIPVASSRENRLVTGILNHADQDGTLKSGAVDNASVLANNVVTSDKLANASITNTKLSTTTGELGGAWQSWTPTITNVTLGNGILTCKYTMIGKTVHFRFQVKAGTTTTSSGVSISLTPPVAPHADYAATVRTSVGNFEYEDETVTSYAGQLIIDNNNKIVPLHIVTNDTLAHWQGFGPTLTNLDTFQGAGTYEAA